MKNNFAGFLLPANRPVGGAGSNTDRAAAASFRAAGRAGKSISGAGNHDPAPRAKRSNLVMKILANGILKRFLTLREEGASQDELARIVAKMEEEEAGEDGAQKKRGGAERS
jgi:hypothetical protein